MLRTRQPIRRQGLLVSQAGGAGFDYIVALFFVSLLGAAVWGGLGAAYTDAVAGNAKSVSPGRLTPAITSRSEAGITGALRRLADVTEFDGLATAAREAATHGDTVNLNDAARAIFGEELSTRPVVRAWRQVLVEAQEGHAVMATEVARAASAVLNRDQLVGLFEHLLETDVGQPFLYQSLDVDILGPAFERILTPFEKNKRFSLIKSLISEEALRHEILVEDFARRLSGDREALARLVDHDDWAVRDALAANPAVSGDLLLRLASDDEVFVRRTVVERPDATKKILEGLRKDSDAFIQNRAVERLAARDHGGPRTKTVVPTEIVDEANPLALPPRDLLLPRRVERVLNALDEGIEARITKTKTWDDLPATSDTSRRLGVAPDAAKIDRRTFVADNTGYEVRVLRTANDFVENKACLGSGYCAGPGSQYEKAVDAGTTIMAGITPRGDRKKILYSAEFRTDGRGGWTLRQFRGYNNAAIASAEVNAAVKELATHLSAGR